MFVGSGENVTVGMAKVPKIQKVSDLKMRRENRAGSRILRVNMVGFAQILAQSLLMR